MVWKEGTGDAYALLGRLVLEQWGVEPLPPIARAERGKPWFPTQPELHFSVSHSGGLVLCALGEGAVGCDIERVRPRREGLPRYCLGDGEYAWFLERGGSWEDFYALWTLKEARVKCTGRGLVRPVREIAVPLLSPGESERFEGFRFAALAGEGTDGGLWRGAVCEKI